MAICFTSLRDTPLALIKGGRERERREREREREGGKRECRRETRYKRRGERGKGEKRMS